MDVDCGHSVAKIINVLDANIMVQKYLRSSYFNRYQCSHIYNKFICEHCPLIDHDFKQSKKIYFGIFICRKVYANADIKITKDILLNNNIPIDIISNLIFEYMETITEAYYMNSLDNHIYQFILELEKTSNSIEIIFMLDEISYHDNKNNYLEEQVYLDLNCSMCKITEKHYERVAHAYTCTSSNKRGHIPADCYAIVRNGRPKMKNNGNNIIDQYQFQNKLNNNYYGKWTRNKLQIQYDYEFSLAIILTAQYLLNNNSKYDNYIYFKPT